MRILNKFGKEFLVVSRIYSRFIANIKIENLAKFYVNILESLPQKTDVFLFEKVCEINKQLNTHMLDEELVEQNRYRIILDIISESVLSACDYFGWPKEDFHLAYAQARNIGFLNEYVLVKPKSSKNRLNVASVVVSQTKDELSLYLDLLYKPTNSTRRVKLIQLVTYLDRFDDIVYSIRWVNNEEIIFSNKDKEIHFRYFINEGKMEMFFTPNIHDEEYLNKCVKLWDPNLTIEEFHEITQLPPLSHPSLEEIKTKIQNYDNVMKKSTF